MKRSYRVLARLGEGGTATVYLAMIGRAGGFRKLVALKVLRDQAGVDARELRESFLREARVSARCHHRNIVQILDVCELDGKPALCMEYLDGQTYRQLRARGAKVGTLPLSEQLRILAEAAHGLHHVHTLRDYEGHPLGLVHCDVSPENVFITYDGQVKLLDFGIAKLYGDEAAPGVRGKLSYLAPESIRGEPVDARADVFALGAMLWEAVCGMPFAGGPSVDDIAKLRNRLTGSEANLRGIEPSAPDALIEIVDRAIALEPVQRYPDAEAFAFALEAYLRLTHAQPSAQTLSKLTIPMFAREAAKLRATIEPQLQLSEHWDREHTSSAPVGLLARSVVNRDRGFDLPEAPFDFSMPDRISLEPPARASVPAIPMPSSTDAVWLERGDHKWKRWLPYLAVIALVVALGAMLGFRDRKPASVALPPEPPAKLAAEPPAIVSLPEPVEPPHMQLEPPALASNAACVELTCVKELRRMSSDERRARRHHERRLRRRAAQCAAGKVEKCSPLPEPY